MTRGKPARRNPAATRAALDSARSGNEIRVTVDDEYMTREQVAKRLKLKPKTLSNWHHLGKGPKCFRLANGGYRYRAADVLKFEEDQQKALA